MIPRTPGIQRRASPLGAKRKELDLTATRNIHLATLKKKWENRESQLDGVERGGEAIGKRGNRHWRWL